MNMTTDTCRDHPDFRFPDIPESTGWSGEASLEACLEREFSATAAVLRSHDFYEGVRAAVVDKDRNPQWRPANLEDVTAEDVAVFFEPSTEPLFAGAAGKGD